MRKHWVTAVMVCMLALVLSAPAWADCKAQMVLTPTAAAGTTTGTAEKRVTTANPLLKVVGRNQFDVDILNGGNMVHYDVMVTSPQLNSGATTKVGGFVTNSAGQGDFDLKGQTYTCSISKVVVVKTLTTTTILSGQFGALNNQVENEVQLEIEAQNEIQNEAQNEIQRELQNEAQPNNTTP